MARSTTRDRRTRPDGPRRRTRSLNESDLHTMRQTQRAYIQAAKKDGLTIRFDMEAGPLRLYRLTQNGGSVSETIIVDAHDGAACSCGNDYARWACWHRVVFERWIRAQCRTRAAAA